MPKSSFEESKGMVECLSVKHPDRTRLIERLSEIQAEYGYIPDSEIETISRQMNIQRIDVQGVITFYHFLTQKPRGKTTIYLTKGAVPSFSGVTEIAQILQSELGIKFGEVTPDSLIGLEWTSCIGMCDQEPALLMDDYVFTDLTPEKTRHIVNQLTKGKTSEQIAQELFQEIKGNGKIISGVKNNIRKKDVVLFDERNIGDAIRKLVLLSPKEVLSEIQNSGLRGRGGAGFPTGTKWSFCLRSLSKTRYVICNADEGEPGTFKDRVILTEIPELLFEGMAVAAYALGAKEGFLYLRKEYAYLKSHLEYVLESMRQQGLLGKSIAGKEGFDFDIRIVMGAGAYICGEETALIESAEGKRGEPRERPPYPVSYGYLGEPTAVNNVETLCCAARIIEKGASWFSSIGTKESTGTKLISISGDCAKPGIYEIPFGTPLCDLLKLAGCENPQAVQVGGPSGACIPPSGYARKIAFEDLATGGAVIVIGQNRDLLRVVRDFIDFFHEESCGRCTPCRVGLKLMLQRLDKILDNRGVASDLEYLRSLGKIIRFMSRCGLGQTAPNPVLGSLESFPALYETRCLDEDFSPEFDIEKAIEAGRVASQTA